MNNIDGLWLPAAHEGLDFAPNSGGQARAAVREFLLAEDPDVRAAAIHSVALWRDQEAAEPLIEVLSQDGLSLRAWLRWLSDDSAMASDHCTPAGPFDRWIRS